MKVLTYILLIFSVLLFIKCENNHRVKNIKLGHSLDVKHSVHLAMVYMAEKLNEKSDGTLKLTIYANQQLGTERQTLELLQLGSLGMTKVSAGVIENFSPKMKIFGVPFLFKNRQHAFDVMDGEIGKELLLDGQHYWLRGLTYYDAGCRSFYTKERPINTPDDLKGLKIRVMESISATNMVKNLGGSPTPISWGEIYTSLQLGVVDGAENNPPSFYLSNHYELCKYYTLDEHTILPDILLISTHLWNSLSELEQLWVEEAAYESAVYQRKLWAISEQEALDAVEKAGVEIIHPDKSKFQEKVQPLYDSYKSNPVIYDLMKRIQSVESNS